MVLGVTAILCSRLIFFMIDDPEGPNLLVVMVMAAVLYGLSLTAWFSKLLASLGLLKRVSAVILFQILLSAGFTILLR